MSCKFCQEPSEQLNQALALIAEGYGLTEVAEKMKMTVANLVVKLNAAREDFAPYAVAWQRELMEAKDDD